MSQSGSPSVGGQEQKLKRVMGTKDVLAMGIGLVIGAGVMSLTGVAIGFTGTGVSIAYLLSAVIMTISTLPSAQMSSAAPTVGGSYRYVSRMIGPKWGFYFIMMYIPMFVALSVYAISFAQYFSVIFPKLDIYIIAIIVFTLFYLVNIIGVKDVARTQLVIVAVLLLSLVAFVGFGLSKVDFAVAFSSENLFPGGAMPLITASVLVSFALFGGGSLAELGGEMKNPARDIPLGIFVSTLGVGILYAVIGVVASGVLPWQDVAGQSLALVAEKILPTPLFWIFIIGGGLGATASTLNATLTYVTKPLVIACQDGFLPKRLGVVNAKTGTPILLLTVFYVVGMIPLILRLPLETISQFCSAIGSFGLSLPPLALFFFIKRHPDLYEKSPFKLPRKLIRPLSIIAFILILLQGVVMLSQFPKNAVLIILAYNVVILVLGFILEKRLPHPADDLKGYEQEKPEADPSGSIE